MSGGRGTGWKTRTASILAAAAAMGLTAAACGPAEEPGAADAPAGDTAPAPAADAPAADAPDTVGPAPDGDTTPEEEAPEAVEPADTAADPSDTSAADTAARRWPPGGYVVYVRRGASPDSVAAAHGVEPDTVLAGLPGFYARLTAEEAGALARDERVRQMARQLEERPAPEPRGIPVAPDTGGGR